LALRKANLTPIILSLVYVWLRFHRKSGETTLVNASDVSKPTKQPHSNNVYSVVIPKLS